MTFSCLRIRWYGTRYALKSLNYFFLLLSGRVLIGSVPSVTH